MKPLQINPLEYLLLFFALLLLFPKTDCRAEQPDTTVAKIQKHARHIERAASVFEIDAPTLAAIIFTERTLNYDWRDEAFDISLFRDLGLNSSIGFCQVKIKTAYYIEYQLNNEDQLYFPGKRWKGEIELSNSKNELLEKISNDSLNILYAAAYLRIYHRLRIYFCF